MEGTCIVLFHAIWSLTDSCDRSRSLIRTSIVGRPTHLSLTRIQTLLEQPSAAICGHLPFRRLQHWVSCPRTNWCVDRRRRESYRLPPKVEEPLYLLGNIEAELGGNVARPSDFETSSKMTRLQKKRNLCFSQWRGNSVYCGAFSYFFFCCDSRMLVSCPGVGQLPSFWNTLLFGFRSFTRSISSSSQVGCEAFYNPPLSIRLQSISPGPSCEMYFFIL